MSTKDERDEEFRAFVCASSQSLSKTAWLLTGDAELAADLVQEAYTRVYAAWGRVRRGEAIAYARRVLVNANVDRWRRGHAETPMEDVDRAEDSNAEAAVDDRDQVARLLAKLPKRQRAVVVLRYANDLSEQAVAEQLGVAVGAVKSAASRGLAALRADAECDLELELRKGRS